MRTDLTVGGVASVLRAALATLVLPCLFAARAQAAIFVVDRSDDTTAAAAQVCSGLANDCSLRGAIIKANGDAVADEIQFLAALDGVPFTLTLAGDEDAALMGDLDVTASLTITGRGPANTIIQAGTDATNGIDKVLALNPTCASGLDFTVTGVTIRFGRNTVAHDARFQDTGGGLDWCGNGIGANEPTLVLSDSVITQNSTLMNSGADTGHYGGGLNIDEASPSNGVVTITNTVFSNNTSAAHGAGLNIFGDNVRVTITGSSFLDNTTLGTGGAGGNGAGINIRITNQDNSDGAPVPFVTIDDAVVSGNQSTGPAAGICVCGAGDQNVTITDAVITGNFANVNGITAPRGGGLLNSGSRPTILERVLIADNHVESGSLVPEGGGIVNEGTNLIVKNSTISGNRSRGSGGGFFSIMSAVATLTNVTITGNRADTDDNGTGDGGGIKVLGGTVTLHNTIVAENFNDATGTTADDVAGSVAAASSFNLIDTGGAGGLTDGVNDNQVGVANPLLAALGSYGATLPALQTHALLPGSRAINAGSNTLATAAGLTIDQRGIARPQLVTVDIGAFESRGFILSKSGGDNQETNILTAFPLQLEVTVAPNVAVEPVDGGEVTFTPPGSGASASLAPNPTTIGAAISGRARTTATANATAGLYSVAADARGSSGGVSFSLRNTAPDLIAVKANTVGGGPIRLGNDWIWTITESNVGDGPAVFAAGQEILSDNLPNSDISYGAVSVSPTSVTGTISCSIVSSNLTCTAGAGGVSIAAATGSFQASFGASPTAVGTFTNPRASGACVADGLGNVPEANEGNNNCNSDGVVVIAPDLSASKANTVAGTATLGGTWDWQITTANGGNASADYTSGQVILTDALPSTNVSYGTPSIGASSGITGTINCALAGGNVVNCTASGAVSIDAPGSFRVDVTATPSATGTFTNPTGGPCQADPNDDLTESNEGNNACNSDGVTVSAPDLAVVKANTVSGATTLGNSWDWRAIVSNGGDASADYTNGQTIFTDTLPGTDVAYGSPSIGASSGVTGAITCALSGGNVVNCTASGAVSIDAPGSFRVDVTATPSATGTFTNPTGGPCQADPNDDLTESNEGNNACNSDGVTVSAPDLAVVKANTVSGATTLGNSWDWRAIVSNGGDASADYTNGQTIFTDTLPGTDVAYGSPSIGASSGVTGAITCALSGGNVVNCTASGAVSIDAPGSFRVDVTATPSANGTFTNPAGGPCQVDPNDAVSEGSESNNACNSDTVAVGAPLLTAAKTVSGAFVPGGTITYTIVISNLGPTASPDNPGDELTDDLPPELALVSASATSGTASTLANTVTWNGTIPAGGSVTVSIAATVNPGTGGSTISNQATIAFDADLDGSNESTVQSDDPAAAGPDDPTTFVAGAELIEIPTLSSMGLLALVLSLMLAGAWKLRRPVRSLQRPS